jgi:hypothetical protein
MFNIRNYWFFRFKVSVHAYFIIRNVTVDLASTSSSPVSRLFPPVLLSFIYSFDHTWMQTQHMLPIDE